jgi:hypothetical protein
LWYFTLADSSSEIFMLKTFLTREWGLKHPVLNASMTPAAGGELDIVTHLGDGAERWLRERNKEILG